jgi:hypothetical protein
MSILDIAPLASRRLNRHLQRKFDLLTPLRNWLDRIEIRDIQTAKTICRLIPASCPFERDFKLFGRTLFHIPSLCHLNPFYEDIITLRYRAEIFLTADRN